MKIVTHSGYFHTDDLLAVATLLLKYPEAEVIRSRDEEVIESADIVVDVGQKYDASSMRFDHHQPSGAGVRDNGIPYASFGLVWKEFGEEVAGGKDEAKIIEDKLIVAVDATDNGVDLYTLLFKNTREYSLGDFFYSFVGEAETLEDLDKVFFEVLSLAKDLLRREIESAKRTADDWREVLKIYDESANKEIIILPANKHWKKILIPTETLFVISPRPDGQWGARAVPKAINSFELKSPFPASWAGLKGGDLSSVSGVSDAVFCHRDIWLANAKTKEGAIALAKIALEN